MMGTKAIQDAGVTQGRNAGRLVRYSQAATTGFALATLILAAGISAASASTCLDAASPDAADDAGQIADLEASIDTACPCSDYDGSEGSDRKAFKLCVAPLVKTAVTGGDLRAACKGTLLKAYKESTCGYAADDDVVTCVETSARGKVSCKVVESSRCADKPGKYVRVACDGFERCVDAADDSGDYRIDSADSGSCLAATTTLAPTTTTEEPTTTTSTTEEPTTTTSTTEEPTTTTTMPALCGDGSPIPVVTVNLDMDGEESVVVPPAAGAPGQCLAQDFNQGGCKLLSFVDGSVDNYFNAGASIDPRACTPEEGALEFHWQIFYPPLLGGAPYAAAGITGYHSPVLTIRTNSLPSLLSTAAEADPFWRVRLTIVAQPRDGEEMTPAPRVLWFRFEYSQTTLDLPQLANCRTMSGPCPEEFSNALPPTEPTCTHY